MRPVAASCGQLRPIAATFNQLRPVAARLRRVAVRLQSGSGSAAEKQAIPISAVKKGISGNPRNAFSLCYEYYYDAYNAKNKDKEMALSLLSPFAPDIILWHHPCVEKCFSPACGPLQLGRQVGNDTLSLLNINSVLGIGITPFFIAGLYMDIICRPSCHPHCLAHIFVYSEIILLLQNSTSCILHG